MTWKGRSGSRGRGLGLIGFLSLIILTSSIRAAEPKDAAELFRVGKYAECERLATEEIARGSDTADWWRWKIRAEVARGQYDAAGKSVEEARAKHDSDLLLHLLGHEVYRASGGRRRQPPCWSRWPGGSRPRALQAAERIALGRFL